MYELQLAFKNKAILEKRVKTSKHQFVVHLATCRVESLYIKFEIGCNKPKHIRIDVKILLSIQCLVKSHCAGTILQ